MPNFAQLPASGFTCSRKAIEQRASSLIIDYGFPRHELLAPHRKDGTYCCYKAHRRDTDPSKTRAKRIFPHMWTSRRSPNPALDAGFRIEGFTDQHHYFVGASQDLLAQLNGPPDSILAKEPPCPPNTPPSRKHGHAVSLPRPLKRSMRPLPGSPASGSPAIRNGSFSRTPYSRPRRILAFAAKVRTPAKQRPRQV